MLGMNAQEREAGKNRLIGGIKVVEVCNVTLSERLWRLVEDDHGHQQKSSTLLEQ